MHHRSFKWTVATLFLLVACRLAYTDESLPTATVISSVTDVPATQIPTAISATITPEVQSGLVTDWLSELEVIGAGNWARLQLLETFPAEMPLDHSAVALAPDGKTLAIGSSSGARILFFDLAARRSMWVDVSGVRNVDAYFNRIEYLADGTLIANSDGPYMIYHLDAAGAVLSSWDGLNFALSTDKKIMAHSTDEGITLVEISTNTPLLSLEDRDGMYFSFSPDGSKIAVENIGVDYLNTDIWDIPSQTRLVTLVNAAEARFSPDGQFLAVIYYDDENNTTPLKVFESDGAAEIITLNASEPKHLINRAAVWSVDGSVLVAQVSNGSSTAWDAANWQALETPALQGLVYSFSSDGRILITRADDGAILLWGVLP